MTKEEHIQIKSPQIEEIINKPPNIIVRSGLVFVLIFLITILTFSLIIETKSSTDVTFTCNNRDSLCFLYVPKDKIDFVLRNENYIMTLNDIQIKFEIFKDSLSLLKDTVVFRIKIEDYSFMHKYPDFEKVSFPAKIYGKKESLFNRFFNK